jgi:hypothetical protein
MNTVDVVGAGTSPLHSCGSGGISPPSSEGKSMENKLQQALEKAQSWMDIEGVEAVGQGKIKDQDCIVVFVSLKTPEIEEKIPSECNGIPVDIQESGVITALES